MWGKPNDAEKRPLRGIWPKVRGRRLEVDGGPKGAADIAGRGGESAADWIPIEAPESVARGGASSGNGACLRCRSPACTATERASTDRIWAFMMPLGFDYYNTDIHNQFEIQKDPRETLWLYKSLGLRPLASPGEPGLRRLGVIYSTWPISFIISHTHTHRRQFCENNAHCGPFEPGPKRAIYFCVCPETH